MLTITGTPIKSKTTVTNAKGVTTVYTYPDQTTSGWLEEQKVTQKYPKFRPGVFLVKPYMVSKRQCIPIDSKASGTYLNEASGSTYKYEFSGSLGCHPYQTESLAFPADPSMWRERAVTSAYGKLYGSLYDTMTELGELKETLEMLRSPFKGLRDFSREFFDDLRNWGPSWIVPTLRDIFRNPHKRRAWDRNTMSLLSDTWLEWRYGARPFIGSIESVAKILKGELYNKLQAASEDITSKRSRYTVTKGTSTKTLAKTGIDFQITTTENTFAHGKVFYRRYKDESLLEALSLSPEGIPATAWELTRMSFVVDWLYGIGPWLQAISPKPGVVILGAISGYKTVITKEILPVYYVNTGSFKLKMPADKVQTLKGSKYQRFTHAGPPSPVWYGPTKMGIDKCVDSLTLLWSSVLKELTKGSPKRYR